MKITQVFQKKIYVEIFIKESNIEMESKRESEGMNEMENNESFRSEKKREKKIQGTRQSFIQT